MIRLVSIFLLACCVLAAPAASDCHADPAPVERAHFVYYFDNPVYIEPADSVLEAVRARLIDWLGDSLDYNASIYLVEDDRRFEQVIGGRFPHWGAAAAVPPRRLIAVKSPDNHHLGKPLPQLLAHEYAHLHVAQRTSPIRPPRWFDEGIAMLVSTEWDWQSNLTMSMAAVLGNLVKLQEIERMNTFAESRARLAYAESYLAVNYLLTEYGVPSVHLFLDSLRAGAGMDAALLASTGSDYEGFEAEFRIFLSERYNIVSLFADTMWLFVALAVVVVIGAFLRFRRRRQYFQKWEEEEKLHSTDFDYGDPDNPEATDDEEPWRS